MCRDCWQPRMGWNAGNISTVKLISHSWHKPHLDVAPDFYILMDCFCYYFVKNFVKALWIHINKGYWSVVLFFDNVFIWFLYLVNPGLIIWMGKQMGKWMDLKIHIVTQISFFSSISYHPITGSFHQEV